jgi:uncharacterized protein (UPF0335 family)
MELITREQKCGCIYKEWYDTSTDFGGYDTDRLEKEYTFCDEHKTLLYHLKTESKHLLRKIDMLHEENNNKNQSVKNIYQHAKNNKNPSVKNIYQHTKTSNIIWV